MGAAQSARAKESGGRAGGGEQEQTEHVDYYEILQVEPTATADEIKKRYRLLALKHHPDKNPDRVEEATKYFHKLQEAFEILSDEQERAWYDTNRERYLNGEFDDTELDEEAFQSFQQGKEAPKPAGSSSPGLTPRHLMRFFDPQLATDFGDSDSSYFGTYRRLFERLAEEEIAAAVYPGEEDGGPPPRSAYPSFGYSHTPFVANKLDSTVHQSPARDFYTVFLNFQTRKSMGWLDRYRLAEAPDRRVKRLMEKENKRAREAGRREYNDTIRALAMFVRKRDPRYKAHTEAQEKAKTGPEAEASKRAYISRMEQQRKATASAFQAQSWQMADEVEDIWSDGQDYASSDDDGDDGDGDEGDNDEGPGCGEQSGSASPNGAEQFEGEGEDGQGWDCVVCDKVFRSEAAYRNHEQSSKHKKALKALQRQMRKENKELGLDQSATMEDEDLAHQAQVLSLEKDLDDMEGLDPKASRRERHAPSAGSPAQQNGIGKSKKAKKKAKKRMKAAAALEDDDDDESEGDESALTSGVVTPAAVSASTESASTRLAESGLSQTTATTATTTTTFSAKDWQPEYKPLSGPAPTGSFTCFGFGSLIWKPPPHAIHSQPGFIKGFTRRFAQHSVDHRGTPERPGRVVTLVAASDWHRFKDADESPEGDIVWGVMYTIDPAHPDEVRAYLDHREKNGYSPQSVDVYGFAGNSEGKEEEVLLQAGTLVYVGLPDNEAFVGPSPLPDLAERIFTCQGPSGRNDEYLLNLAMVTRKLSPQSVDSHLFELEKRVLQLQREAAAGTGRGAELAALLGKPDHMTAIEAAAPSGAKKSRRAKKEQRNAAASEMCNVCGKGFDSRSKLFTHVREEGHALAVKGSLLADDAEDAASNGSRGKKGGKKSKR
ncbi:unnamed protein product [Parajaminaea phylloscopi]